MFYKNLKNEKEILAILKSLKKNTPTQSNPTSLASRDREFFFFFFFVEIEAY